MKIVKTAILLLSIVVLFFELFLKTAIDVCSALSAIRSKIIGAIFGVSPIFVSVALTVIGAAKYLYRKLRD